MPTSSCNRSLRCGRIGLIGLVVLLLAVYVDLLQALPLAFSQQITTQFQLSLVQFSQLMNAHETPLVLLLLFFGFLIDVTGAKRMSIIALVLLTLGNYLFSTAASPSGLLTAQFLIGIGTTFVTVSLLAFMATRLSANLFVVLAGLFISLSTLAKFFGVNLHVMLMNSNWKQTAYELTVIGAILIILFAVITHQKSNQNAERQRLNLDELIHTLSNRNIWLAAIVGTSGYLFVYLFLSSIGPIFFHTAGQFRQPELLNLFNYGILSLCVGLIIFALLAYFALPYKWLLKIGYGLGIISFMAAMVCLTHHSMSIIFLCVASFGSSAYILSYAILYENSHKRCFGVSFGIFFIVIYVGSLLISLLARHLMSDFLGTDLIEQHVLLGPWLSVIMIVPVLFIIGVVCVCFVKEPKKMSESTASLSSQLADCWRGIAHFGRSFWLIYVLGGLLVANVGLVLLTLFDPFLIQHELWSPLAISYLLKTLFLIAAMPCLFKSHLRTQSWCGWKVLGIIAALFLLVVSIARFLQSAHFVNLEEMLLWTVNSIL